MDTSHAPFYDDYNPQKGFHKILFRPRVVQARELNQLQSILQEQINRMGSHFFKDGSVVGEGSISLKERQDMVKIVLPVNFDPSFFESDVSLNARSSNSGLNAKILKYLPIDGSTGWLALEYLNSDGTEGAKFENASTIIVSQDIDGSTVDIIAPTVSESALGFYASVLEGVYFVGGNLVWTNSQDILIPEEKPSKLVGFRIDEEVIDETTDASLYSNASGEPNFKGAGACRLKVTLKLEAIEKSEKDDTFIEIVDIDSGVIQSVNDNTQYAVFNDILAQRTYEESGNYTVTHPPIELLEHIRDAVHVDGLYSASEGGKEDTFVARLKRGISYVQGYRHEIVGYKDVEIGKARDTKIVNNGVLQASYGSFVVVTIDKGLPKLDLTRLHSLVDESNSLLGTCKIRSIKREGSSAILYLMDINMSLGRSFGSVKRILGSFSPSDTFEATLTASSVFGGTTDSLLFSLPYSNVSSLTGAAGQDVSFNVTRSFDVSLDASGKASIGLTGSELFNSVNSFDYFASVNGDAALPVSGISLAGSPIGKALNLDFGASYAGSVVRVVTSIVKTNPTYKTKTLREVSENISFNESSSVKLNKADIYRIISVTNTDSGLDMTPGFTFFDGQRPNWYEVGELISSSGNITANVSVTYEYFEHSNTGDFFCVDSYDIPRNDIPTSKEASDRVIRSLADCIDFRVLKASDGSFTNLPAYFDVINPNDNVRIDLTMYLPRIDVLYVSSSGNYSVTRGVPSENPKTPTIPADGMALYQLHIPAYTDSVTQIKAIKVENKRFTMADIGRLEKRIENAEYYISLSQCESKAERTQILDPVTGNNRFKNGIAADRFKDFKLVDVLDSEWAASIDTDLGQVAPPMVQNGIDMNYVSGAQKHTSTVSLPYTLVEFASQPYATTTSNINPFAVFSWAGSVTLTPAQDFWRDTVYNKPIVLNVTDDLTNGLQAGDQLLSSTVSSAFQWSGSWRNTVETTTQTYLNTKITSSTDVKVDDSRVSLSVIPYMRSIEVKFDLRGFKPLTRLYPFFSGVAVSSQCAQTGKAYGESIVTDVSGNVTGTFKVPNTNDFRFKTGSNILKFTDSVNNDDNPNNNFTSGEATHLSGGELEVRQKTTTITKTIRAEQTKWTSSSSRVTARWNRDPVAQTFSISKDGGGFIKAVDIFFSTKAKTIPVTLQVRNVYNGVPSNEVLTFGEVVLNPSEVKVSDNGTVATQFVFSDPVYLEKDREYAIVLLADTQEYNVYLARMGEIDLSNRYVVAKQPHTGVFFVSSNGQTWTANQLEDLKFKIHGCKFKTDSSYVATLEGSAPESKALEYNAISTTLDSNNLVFRCLGHGLKVGDYVEVAGAVSGNGVDASLINTRHRVTASTAYDFSVEITSASQLTGAMGGGSIFISANNPFNKVCPWLGSFVLDGTSMSIDLVTNLQENRTSVTFQGLESDTFADMPFDAISSSTLKPKLNVTLQSDNEWISPLVDLDGAGLEMVGHCINSDPDNVLANVVTRSLKFNNPSTSAKIYVVGRVPFGSNVILKYKAITSGDDNLTLKEWSTADVSKAFKNSSTDMYEAEFEINAEESFLGLKLKLELLGEVGSQSPVLEELRLIALA